MNSKKQVIHKNLYLLKRMYKLFAPYRYSLTISFLAGLLVAGATMATTYLVKPALDDIFLGKNEFYLYLLPFAFIAATLVKGIGRYLQNYCMTYAGLRVIEDLRMLVYNKIVHLPSSYHIGSSIGEMMSRVMNDVGSMRSSIPSVVMMIRQIFTIIGLIFTVIWQSPALSIYSILALPIAFYPLIIFSRRLRKFNERTINLNAIVTSQLQETFSGISVIKAFSTEKYEEQRFVKNNRDILETSLRHTRVSELASPVMELIGSVGIAITIFIGGYEVIQGNMTSGSFFAFLVAVMMMYDPVKSIMLYSAILQGAFVSAERVYGLLDSDTEKVEEGGDIELIPPVVSIRYQHVSKAYISGGTNAVDDVSFTVEHGQRIALVGPSGAGKTTLVNLLPRFYTHTQGIISINDTPIEEYTLHSLRRNIALVSQNTYLFNRSVAENIAYGVEGAIDMEKVYEIAKMAYCHDFILELPQGYDTTVGDGGSRLSGGQRQRITIARALFKDAPILILDEATSALDSESEAIIQKALDNLLYNRTSIVIAHRLSTILRADMILVMDKGRVLERGTHRELLATSPLYQKLYTLQFESQHDDFME
ncbi:MAG: ATP-binding cassette domain-containing protein [Desulfovibrionaceae bacterium]|nr:ATP-binding cassette domain-containing protein [Desulfovibrionaceae bacterium]